MYTPTYGSGWHPLFVKGSSLPREHAIHFHVMFVRVYGIFTCIDPKDILKSTPIDRQPFQSHGLLGNRTRRPRIVREELVCYSSAGIFSSQVFTRLRGGT